MAPAAPHSHPLRPWHDVALALATGAQVFALAHASPWLPRSWALSLALITVVIAAPPPLRPRSVNLALALRLAQLCAAFLVAGLLLGAPPAYPRAHVAMNLLVAAHTLWALQAPITMTRWWVRARPSHDAALELAEVTGWSLLATALALTAANAQWAWSTSRGTAWSTALCALLGVASLAYSWVAQALRRAWMRRVLADRDPAWQTVEADGASSAAPWAHASVESAPSLRLTPRAPEAHYRDAAETNLSAAQIGARDARAWWIRRALHGFSGAWGAAIAVFFASTLLNLHRGLPSPDRDPEAEVSRLLREGLRVPPTPCEVRERSGAASRHRVFEFEGARAEVWASGRLVLASHNRRAVMGDSNGGTRFETISWFANRCVPPEVASTWIDDPRPAAMIALPAIHTLRAAPRQEVLRVGRRVSCGVGAWCAIGWRTAPEAISYARATVCGVGLDATGGFECVNGENETTSGVVEPRDALRFLNAMRALSSLRGPSRQRPTLDGYVRVGADPTARALDFDGADHVWEQLRRRLCMTR